jgi:hypothetical protein
MQVVIRARPDSPINLTICEVASLPGLTSSQRFGGNSLPCPWV